MRRLELTFLHQLRLIDVQTVVAFRRSAPFCAVQMCYDDERGVLQIWHGRIDYVHTYNEEVFDFGKLLVFDL
jgi:hypothetical protein